MVEYRVKRYVITKSPEEAEELLTFGPSPALKLEKPPISPEQEQREWRIKRGMPSDPRIDLSEIMRKGVEKFGKWVDPKIEAYLKHGQSAMKLWAVAPQVALGIEKEMAPERAKEIVKAVERPWSEIWKESPAGKLLTPSTKFILEHPVVGFVPWFLGEFIPGELLEAGTRPSTWAIWGAAERIIPIAARGVFKKLPKSVQEALLRERHILGRQPIDFAYKELGIKKGASPQTIRSAYAKATKRWHPDIAPKGQETQYARRFIRVATAYDKILKSTGVAQKAELLAKRMGRRPALPSPVMAGGMPYRVGQKVTDITGKTGIIKKIISEAGIKFYSVAFPGVKELAKLSEGMLRPLEIAKPVPPVGEVLAVVKKEPWQLPFIRRLDMAQTKVNEAISKYGFGGITKAEQHPELLKAKDERQEIFNQIYETLNPDRPIGTKVISRNKEWTLRNATFDTAQTADMLKRGIPTGRSYEASVELVDKEGNPLEISVKEFNQLPTPPKAPPEQYIPTQAELGLGPSLTQTIKSLGGIAPYKKGMPGALREEYRENVPIFLRNRAGLPLDEMADTLARHHPEFGITSDSELLEVLGKEGKVTTRIARIRTRLKTIRVPKERTKLREELRSAQLELIASQLTRLAEVAPHLVTPKQQAYIHILKDQKALTDRQYRRLLRIFTGKPTMARITPTRKIRKRAMTKEEAARAIGAIKGVVSPPGRKPVIPMRKALTPPGFFERKFAKPTLIKYIFPSDRYARALGVYDLIEPSMQAKMKLGLEKQKMFRWVDSLAKEYTKIKKVPWLTIKKGMIRGKTVPQYVELYNNLDNPGFDPTILPEAERNIFLAMRNCTKTMLARVNEIRVMYGLDPIIGIKGYIRHIFDIVSREDIRIKYPFPEDLKHILPKIKMAHIYNPTAISRMWREEGLLRDPFKALKAMISVDLKQIYLEGPTFMFREQIDALQKGITAEGMPIIPTETRQWAEDFINVVIKGYPTSLDKLANATIETLRIDKVIDFLLKPIGKGIGINKIRTISYGVGRLIHDATIWGRIKLVVRNHTQKLLGLGLYDSKAFVKAFGPESPELKSLIDNSLFFQVSQQTFMEELPSGALAKLERIGFAPYGHSHAGRIGGNVPFTMKQAYHASKELVTNPKYKKLGWTMEDVAKEMDFGANTCQYWYNLMGMPEIFRSGLGKIFGRLQSWWMNYSTKYWGEMLHRTFKGTTGWGKPIPPKWRIGALRHIIASLIFIEGMRRAFGLDYRRTALLGVLPAWLNPAGQIVIGLYNLVTAKTDWQKGKAKRMVTQSWKAFIPGSLAWKDFMKVWHGDRPFKSLFFYEEFKKKKPTKYKILDKYRLKGKDYQIKEFKLTL